MLQNGAVTNEKVADGAITSVKIAVNAITTEKIDNGAVTAAKLGSDVVIGTVGDGAIATSKLADGSVTEQKLATNSVTSAKIKTGAVGSSELATNSVIATKIAAGSITPEKLSFSVPSRPLTPPLTTVEIGDGQVTQAKLAPGVGGGGDTLTMLPAPATALDQGGIVATTQPAQVDLSTIIPVNTKGVIVSIACINQSYVSGGMMAYIFRQLGAEYALQVGAPPVDAPGISNGGSVLMPVASDRTLLWQAYVSGANSTELVIYILGYIV